MKIGIITYWDSNDNYGQQLQCYALQEYLRQQGHEPYLIRYKEQNTYKTGFKFSKFFEYVSHFKSYYDFIIQRRNNEKYDKLNRDTTRGFPEFRQQYITMSDVEYDDLSIRENPPVADAYICGSDQIWTTNDIFYLSFVTGNKTRIAYAPSFGGGNPFCSDDRESIIALLNKFKCIGMREKSGVELLSDNGITDALQVADPTLLLSVGQYKKIADGETCKPHNAFVYLLGNQIAISTDVIFNYIKSTGLEFTYVASQGRVDNYTKKTLTIPQWIRFMAESEFVITNSFHCVVFALTFHKPFMFIPLSGAFARMNDRVIDLLGQCHLSHLIYNGDFDILKNTIDFSHFDGYKRRELSRSHQFLTSGLELSL